MKSKIQNCTHKSEPRRPYSNPRLRSQRIEPIPPRNPGRHELQRASEPQPLPQRPPSIATLPEHRRDRALQHHRRHREQEHRKDHHGVERGLPLQQE